MDILDVSDSGLSMDEVNPTVIKVLGCGGCGGNAVNTMVEAGITGVKFIALNTDLQQLSVSKAEYKLQIGKKLTNGLGAGMHPEVGEAAAKEEEEAIKQLLQGSDMVFITAGMGGGTGTGSAPIVAKIAHDLGILTVAVVTTPFSFEGPIRMQLAEEGIKKLRSEVDSLIVIPNQRVFEGAEKKLSAINAFKVIDDILRQGVQGISDIITKTGIVNRDFKDVESVMKGQGDAILGIGVGEGENRAVDAATNAINNKLLAETHIDGAKNILINICGNEDVAIDECEEISNLIKASADKNVRVLWGLYIDRNMGDKISVTVIATGFNKSSSAFIQETEKEETVTSDDPNMLSIGDFISIRNGNTTISNATNFKQSSLFDDENVQPVKNNFEAEEKTSPLSSALRSSSRIAPPDDFKNDDDIKKPAIWRRRPEGLSPTINLKDN